VHPGELGRHGDHVDRSLGRVLREVAQPLPGPTPQRGSIFADPAIPEPSVPENVRPADLEASARRELRALGRANAENVSRHLVMLQRLLVSDPELAYQHARYAASHAGRVAVVRESAGIAAYLAGHYAEALKYLNPQELLHAAGSPELIELLLNLPE